jgi:hypothetical protein
MDMASELRSGRWAPWWVYLVVIAPVNMGKEQLLSGQVGWPVRAALTVGIVAAGMAVVTAVYRMSRDARL